MYIYVYICMFIYDYVYTHKSLWHPEMMTRPGSRAFPSVHVRSTPSPPATQTRSETSTATLDPTSMWMIPPSGLFLGRLVPLLYARVWVQKRSDSNNEACRKHSISDGEPNVVPACLQEKHQLRFEHYEKKRKVL